MILVLGYIRQNSYSQKMLVAVLRGDMHEITTVKWFGKKVSVRRGGRRREGGGGEAVRADGADVDCE